MLIPTLPIAEREFTEYPAEVRGKSDSVSNSTSGISGTTSQESSAKKEKEESAPTPSLDNVPSDSRTPAEGNNPNEKSPKVVSNPAIEYYDADFSRSYIRHNTAVFIESMRSLLTKWESTGEADSVSEVSQIRTLTERNSTYLSGQSSTRILLGAVQVIFQGDRWEKMNTSQISGLNSALGIFKSGIVTDDKINTFSKEIWGLHLV